MLFAVVVLALGVVADASYPLPQPVVPAAVYGVPEVKSPIVPATTYGVPFEKTVEIAPVKTEYSYTVPITPSLPAPVYGLPNEKIPLVPAPVYGVPVKQAPVVPAPIYGLPEGKAPVVPAITYGVPVQGVQIAKKVPVVQSVSSVISPIDRPLTNFYTAPVASVSSYSTSQILAPQFYKVPNVVVPQTVYGAPQPAITSYNYKIPNIVVEPPVAPHTVYGTPEVAAKVVVPKPHTTYGVPL